MYTFKQGYYKLKNKDKCLNNDILIRYRSTLEKKFIQICDDTKKITKWSSRKIKVPYIHDEKEHFYFPAFYIEILNSKTNIITKSIIELSSSDTITQPITPIKTTPEILQIYGQKTLIYHKQMRKIAIIDDFCQKNNIKFYVLTEKILNDALKTIQNKK